MLATSSVVVAGWAELWVWPHSLGSVTFFSKTKSKVEKVANYSNFTPGLKPRLLRSIDRQDDYCNPLGMHTAC